MTMAMGVPAYGHSISGMRPTAGLRKTPSRFPGMGLRCLDRKCPANGLRIHRIEEIGVGLGLLEFVDQNSMASVVPMGAGCGATRRSSAGPATQQILLAGAGLRMSMAG
jgi:hypothetical protein